jgi:histidinol-phosphatase (PHP family)
MSQIRTYHNHTTFSDGQNSMLELFQAAKAAGLREIGVSDHCSVVPDFCSENSSWEMPPARLDEYCTEFEKVRAQLEDENFSVRLGIEIDYFAETLEESLKLVKSYPFDYIIGSVHFSGSFPLDSSADNWKPLNQEQIDEMHRIYWKKLKELVNSGLADIIGHLDIPKKFCFLPTWDYTAVACEVLQDIAANDLALEINTAGWYKDCQEQYPALPLLQQAAKLKIPLLANPDAHETKYVLRGIPEGRQLIRDLGYTTTVAFANRRRYNIPLAD